MSSVIHTELNWSDTLSPSSGASFLLHPPFHSSRSSQSQGLSLPVILQLLQFSSVQLLSRVRLFGTPWIAARQASLSITNSQSLLRFTSIKSMMPWSHLILSSPSSLAPNPSQHQSHFQWVNSSHEVAKVLEFQLLHHSFQRNPRADLL